MRNSSPATPGVTSCITPASCSYIPSLGRILTGGEKLAFQGIPFDRLQLGQETEMQLGDLAGNAMSLTVITAAMLRYEVEEDECQTVPGDTREAREEWNRGG